MLRFGTDGIRGRANETLTVSLALALGVGVGEVLGASRVIIGRDTRESGPMLVAGVAAGLMSMGVDVVDLGVAPTGAIAFASSLYRLPAVVVSASHNPYFDNGLKVFSAGGRKLSDQDQQAVEDSIEAFLHSNRPRSIAAIGTLDREDVSFDYRRHILSSVGAGRDRGSLRVVLDLANGAATSVAKELFGELGVQVVRTLSDNPSGRNINEDCGSTSIDQLRRAVVDSRADVGLAFDGDADRVIAVSESGEVVDGDQLMAMFAPDLYESGKLKGAGIAATVMSNLGLHRAMERLGVSLFITPVGDRFVLDAMEANGLSLGGEQSGHIIFSDYATTGDGLLTGSMLIDLLDRSNAKLSEMSEAAMVKYPQVLISVTVSDPKRAASSDRVRGAIEMAESFLGGSGRILLRPSGTEPVVRVMVEAETHSQARSIAEGIVASIDC
ncbi:MAG: phosphoglucosamine mutase [Acidimicrobiaceae bacterium]|nr:phosphoglucosamine mutase [Acidimicrobiaceae bacterium]